jgi:hypothetical protein
MATTDTAIATRKLEGRAHPGVAFALRCAEPGSTPGIAVDYFNV